MGMEEEVVMEEDGVVRDVYLSFGVVSVCEFLTFILG
jgi:hypothetical protein